MSTQNRPFLANILTPVLVIAGMLVAGLTATLARPAHTSAEELRYCSQTVHQDCLDPITALVWTKRPPLFPTADCKVYFRFYNPNDVTVPRTISVFHNGTEVFGDDDFLAPGLTPALGQPPLTFGPLANGEWRIVVSSLGQVFADRTFDFNCGAQAQSLSQLQTTFRAALKS
jgi:hypothetical protein